MNDRIKQLASRCRIETYGVNGELLYEGFDEEKFAELIVRECAKFLEDNSGYDDANNSWHPEPEDLLNHFGLV